MSTVQRLGVMVMSATLVLFTCSAWCQDAKPKAEAKQQAGSQTLGNLMKAYDGESNASARYAAFAKKADEEGYGQVASLFRAASKAEEIHAKRHSEVIKKMGGSAKADVKTPDVKSTKENLEAALKGETDEAQTMYPEFIKLAKEKNEKGAVRVFNFAKAAEEDHMKFYKEALDNLDKWKSGKKDFYVCGECGRTATELPEKKCPVCFEPTKIYQKVN